MYQLIDIIDVVEQLIAIINAMPDFVVDDVKDMKRDDLRDMLIDILHQLWYYKQI